MADRSSSLTFKLFGRDVSASKALRGVGKTGDQVGKGLSGLGMAFAGAGTMAIALGVSIAAGVGKASVDAFNEAELKAAAFNDTMSRFSGLAAYKSQLEDLAGALALKTKYDDDETKAAIATLARYNLTGKQLATLTPLVQDFASATGQELGSASTAVGKALLGNTKALKSLGIAYKPTGDKAKDFAAITALLQEKVGGFAEKEGKTAAGTAAILGNQFGEVQETIGSYLVPALVSIGQWIITSVIPAVQLAVTWFKDHLLPIIQAVGKWIMETAVPALQGMASAFMENVWPAIQQVAAMVAENLQPALEAVGQFWNESLLPFLKASVPAFVAVAKVIGGVVAAFIVVTSWIVGKVAPIVTWIGKRFYQVMTAVASYIDPVVEAWKAGFNAISDIWNNTIGGMTVHVPGIPGTDIGNYDVTIPKMPRMAKGGIVTSPTIALIGEAGPEAVVPLSRGRGFGGTHVTVNVTQPLGTPQQVGRAVLDALRQAQGSGRAVINL